VCHSGVVNDREVNRRASPRSSQTVAESPCHAGFVRATYWHRKPTITAIFQLWPCSSRLVLHCELAT
jgi:hypothetical protein